MVMIIATTYNDQHNIVDLCNANVLFTLNDTPQLIIIRSAVDMALHRNDMDDFVLRRGGEEQYIAYIII